MKTARLAFLGDVHGMVGPLESALDSLGGTRHLVLLGDYVNRGPDSKAVLQLLLQARAQWPEMITLLRGNHDQQLLDFIDDHNIARFARFGGLQTIASYAQDDVSGTIEAFLAAFPSAHLELLKGLADYFECRDVFASHCGPNPDRPASRQRNDVATGSNPRLFDVDVLDLIGKTVVCGHYVQRSMVAFSRQGMFAIDTGCGSIPGGPLTALMWPEGTHVEYGGANAGRH